MSYSGEMGAYYGKELINNNGECPSEADKLVETIKRSMSTEDYYTAMLSLSELMSKYPEDYRSYWSYVMVYSLNLNVACGVGRYNGIKGIQEKYYHALALAPEDEKVRLKALFKDFRSQVNEELKKKKQQEIQAETERKEAQKREECARIQMEKKAKALHRKLAIIGVLIYFIVASGLLYVANNKEVLSCFMH